MSPFRFTIAGFFTVVTLVALGLAAIVSQSRLGGSAAYTGFVALLCLALVGAIVRPFPARTFWLGFAIFGWTYWLVEFETQSSQSSPALVRGLFFYPPAGNSHGQPGLVTRELLSLLVNRMTSSRHVGAKVMGQWRGGTYYSGTITEVSGDQYLIVWDDGSAPQWTPSSGIMPGVPEVIVAGHSLLGGLFALLGGVLAAVLLGRVTEP
jgi:hypothetical protein